TDQFTWIGGSAEFEVQATGENLRYQWLKNGTPLPGETNSSLRVTNATRTDAGLYSARVSTTVDSVTTPETKLNLTPIVWWGEDSGANRTTKIRKVFALSSNPPCGLVLKREGILQRGGIVHPPPPVPVTTTGIVAVAPFGSPVAVRKDGRVISWQDNSWS